jgi:hypothetical protein
MKPFNTLSLILLFSRAAAVGFGFGLGSAQHQIFNGLMVAALWLTIEVIWMALKPQQDESETESN